MSAPFIVLSGVDGSGKTTQAALLAESLAARGVAATLTRAPGGTPAGLRLRELLMTQAFADPMTSLSLFLADRAEQNAAVIGPALARGDWVISDRYAESTLAYQTTMSDDPRAWRDLVVAWHRQAGWSIPGLTIILDVDLPVALARIAARGAPDRDPPAERLGLLAEALRSKDVRFSELSSRTVLVDGAGAPEDVHARVLAVVDETFRRRA